MAGLLASADAEEAATAAGDGPSAGEEEEQGWEWVYDEETVRQERAEAAARVEKTTKHWDSTWQAASSIKKHLSTLEEDTWIDGPPGGGGGGAGSTPGGRAGAFREGTAEQQRKMFWVADRMAHTQQRFATWRQHHSEQEEIWRQGQQRMAERQEAIDARCLEKQHEMKENQRRRAFNNAQRRSEQQKTLRERQKEKDRVWEAYYDKMHPAPHDQDAEPASPGSSHSPLSRGISAPSLGLDDAIHRSMLASHATYASQLDQWKGFVAENERRTDAQWKKILQGANKEDYIGEDPMARLQRKVKEVGIRSAFRKGVAMAKQRSSIAEAALSESEGLASPPESPGSAFLTQLSLSDRWRSRKLQCTQHAEDRQKALLEFSVRHEQSLDEAQQRVDAANLARVNSLKESSRLWMQRSNDATERRRQLDVSNDEEFVRKHTAAAQRRADENERQEEARTHRLRDKVRHVMKVQVAAKLFVQAKSDAAQTGLEKLDVASAERENLKKAEALARIERDSYAERRDKAAERRKADQRAFVVGAKREIATKNVRSDRNLHKLRRSVMERERELRKERAAREHSPTLGGPSSPSSASDGAGFLPKLSGSMSVPILCEPVPSSPIRPLLRRPSTASEPPDDSEDESDEAQGQGKVQFLQELEGRCGEWLSDLRRKKKMVAV